MTQHKDQSFSLPQAEPLLIVISGPSAVGKDSIIKEMKKRDASIHFVVTATTRPAREGEVHGEDYFFLTNDAFAELIDNNELLEHTIVYNDYKGIPKQQVREALASGKDVILRIDVQGAATIREMCPDSLLIFVTTNDEDELIHRLKTRKSETPEGLKLRIATARHELTRMDEFDYVVINHDGRLAETVDTILAIIQAEHHRTSPRKVTL